MKIWFAGCARNCSDRLTSNVMVLLQLAEAACVDDLKVYIAENDSTDNTRDTILSLASNDSRVVPVLLESLDDKFCTRESRIAFCRDRLLDTLMLENMNGLYCPIDLDIDFACLGDHGSFLASCQLVDSGVCTAVFPSSAPFYYDIHALRARGWCLNSCWKEIQHSKARGALWNLLVYLSYVSSRQRSFASLQSNGLKLIPVISAFGGIGAYSLRIVAESGARYSSTALSNQDLKLCEHVVFNSYLGGLFVNPSWAVAAPSEHIEFRLLSTRQQILRIAKVALSDIKRIALKFLK